jgi:hypothetical protein
MSRSLFIALVLFTALNSNAQEEMIQAAPTIEKTSINITGIFLSRIGTISSYEFFHLGVNHNIHGHLWLSGNISIGNRNNIMHWSTISAGVEFPLLREKKMYSVIGGHVGYVNQTFDGFADEVYRGFGLTGTLAVGYNITRRWGIGARLHAQTSYGKTEVISLELKEKDSFSNLEIGINLIYRF